MGRLFGTLVALAVLAATSVERAEARSPKDIAKAANAATDERDRGRLIRGLIRLALQDERPKVKREATEAQPEK